MITTLTGNRFIRTHRELDALPVGSVVVLTWIEDGSSDDVGRRMAGVNACVRFEEGRHGWKRAGHPTEETTYPFGGGSRYAEPDQDMGRFVEVVYVP